MSSVKRTVKKVARSPIINPTGAITRKIGGAIGGPLGHQVSTFGTPMDVTAQGMDGRLPITEAFGGGSVDPRGLMSNTDVGRKAQQYRLERMTDQAIGRKAAGERFADVKSGDLDDIISRRREQLEGLTSGEKNLLETQGIGGIQQAEQGALRQLRGIQGATGVRGATAGAQQADVLQEGLMARGDLQRDIVMQDINARRQALDNLETTLGKERLGFLTRELGEAGLGAAERGAAIQHVVGMAQANAPQKVGKK
jgi:hypothetical protein